MTAKDQAQRYLNYLQHIMVHGKMIYPRGEEVREVSDLQLKVNPSFPFMTFKARKYDVNYFKKEMLWKLGASQYDRSIMEHAKMWNNVINPDGTFNSNYGQFWFGTQGGIWSVVTELIRDNDSRRAVIPMLSAKHMEPWVKDTVCTEAVGFRIRNSKLDMSVHMRSSDSIFGLGTDIATFTFLYHLVKALVTPCVWLDQGTLTITCMSAHIYARHYTMVSEMLEQGTDAYLITTMPSCDFDEAMYLISKRGNMVDWPERYNLVSWLMR